MTSPRALLVPALVLGAIAALTVVGVSSTLRRPEVPTYTPTVPRPAEAGEAGEADEAEEAAAGPSGAVVYTVDASDPERWRFFDFSRGSVVEDPGELGWDLAFRRFVVAVNGGPGFAGKGGALDLGKVAFEAVDRVPVEGYLPGPPGRDSANPAFERWYDYGFTSHLLTPKARVYAVRTADGRYAKLELLSYYCPGPRPGCVTFRYVYQGAGGTGFVAGR